MQMDLIEDILEFARLDSGRIQVHPRPTRVSEVIARIAHSILYLLGRQPGRTISFAISLLAMLALMSATLTTMLMGPS